MLCLSRNPVMIVPYKTDEICYKNEDRFRIVWPDWIGNEGLK